MSRADDRDRHDTELGGHHITTTDCRPRAAVRNGGSRGRLTRCAGHTGSLCGRRGDARPEQNQVVGDAVSNLERGRGCERPILIRCAYAVGRICRAALRRVCDYDFPQPGIAAAC